MDIPQCKTLKDKYNECFNRWKSKCWNEKTLYTLDMCNDVHQVE